MGDAVAPPITLNWRFLIMATTTGAVHFPSSDLYPDIPVMDTSEKTIPDVEEQEAYSTVDEPVVTKGQKNTWIWGAVIIGILIMFTVGGVKLG
jgi:hypothetical protein